MDQTKRGTAITGGIFVCLGVLLVVLNLIPGIHMRQFWPLIILALAIAFFLPVIIWPSARHGLSGLLIPGVILLSLGLMFLYNTISRDWAMWAYGWLLIPAGTGLGIAAGSWIGGWGKGSLLTGLWIGLVSLALFAFFAALFGTLFLRIFGAGVLIVAGILFLLRAVSPSKVNP